MYGRSSERISNKTKQKERKRRDELVICQTTMESYIWILTHHLVLVLPDYVYKRKFSSLMFVIRNR